MNFIPTIEQENVKEYFAARLNEGVYTSIFLNAVAGSGKTSTIMYLVEVLKLISQKNSRSYSAVSLSFNSNIREASQKKLTAMGSSVKALTTNQLGRGILAESAKRGLCVMPEGKADGRKYDTITRDLLGDYKNDPTYFPVQKTRWKDYSKCVYGTLEVINALRNTRTAATTENIIELVLHYRMEEKVNIFSPYFPLIVEMSGQIIQAGIDAYNEGYKTKDGKTFFKAGWHNFDDQICLPLDLDLVSRDKDIIFIDEAQDLNTARLQLITRALKEDGLLFFVGDPSQSIQGFTYSDTEAVETIKTVTRAREFPLSVCFRCEENIIRLAQVLVNHIQARPAALAGIVDTIQEEELVKSLSQGDLVLCRVKAPLVDWCLKAIRAGFNAIVRGRDIGTSTIALLTELLENGTTLDTVLTDLENWAWKESQKVKGKKDEEALLDAIQDKAATLEALYDGYVIHLSDMYDVNDITRYGNVEDLKDFITSKFSDDETAVNGVLPIVFSTVHKAKGLEYKRVFILNPEKMPHPMAKEGWQTKQEYNILYVAITRAMEALYFVGGVPMPLAATYNTMKEEEAAALAGSVTITEIYEEMEILQIAAPVQEEEIVLEGLEEASQPEEVNEIVLETAPEGQETGAALVTGKVQGKAGRPPVAASDKVVQSYIRTSPYLKEAVLEFVKSLEGGDFHQLIPFAGKSLAMNDIIIAALLAYEPFMQFFQASPLFNQYIESQSRVNPNFKLPASQGATDAPDLEASQPAAPVQVEETGAALEEEKESVLTGYAEMAAAALAGSDTARRDLDVANMALYMELQEKKARALEDEKIVDSTLEASQPEARAAGIVQDKRGNEFVLLHLFDRL